MKIFLSYKATKLYNILAMIMRHCYNFWIGSNHQLVPTRGVKTTYARVPHICNHHALTNQCIFQPMGADESAPRDYAVLTVSDTGFSIEPHDLERIFEPFYTKKKMGRSGTGLEMAVVWATVKDHNGYITAHNEEGKGTTFTLYFPAAST